jgi:hypothetical protein
MGARFESDAPAEIEQDVQLKPMVWAKGSRRATFLKVSVSVVLLLSICGVVYAAYRLTTQEIPKSGSERSINLHLNSPYGSLKVSGGAEKSKVCRLDIQTEESESPPAMFLRYVQGSNRVGDLRVTIGDNEGMLNSKPPLVMWKASSPQFGLTNANYISGDNGSGHSYGIEPRFIPIEVQTPSGVSGDDYKSHLHLTRDVPISFNAQLGFGTSLIDLTGIPIQQAYVETGASKVQMVMAAPNPVQMSTYSVSAGLGECAINGISNSNAARFQFDGGIGYYTLGFDGELQHNMDASVSVGLGKVTIFIPAKTARVQIFFDDNLFSAYQFDGIPQRRSGYASSVGFDRSNAPTLTLHLSSGMGKMHVIYR